MNAPFNPHDVIRMLRGAVLCGATDGWDVRPGDLVLEISNFRYDPEGLGELLAITDHGNNVKYSVRSLLTGDEHTWENCEFVAILRAGWRDTMPSRQAADGTPGQVPEHGASKS